MPNTLQSQIEALDPKTPDRTSRLVDAILARAVECCASDVHVEPTNHSLEVRFRLDGVLHKAATLNRDLAANVIASVRGQLSSFIAQRSLWAESL